jgi:hypothetical protein
MPDALFRKTKALAALRGSSLKDLIIGAVEREVSGASPERRKRMRRKLPPLIHLQGGRKLDLTHFDFDDLLA